MKIKQLLKHIKCKFFVCCGSKCSLNDTDGDGIVDSIKIESIEEQKEKYNEDLKF